MGPGWVDTKTHREVLEYGPSAGEKYHETKNKYETGGFTNKGKIIKFIDWALTQRKDVLGGRNFSIRGDIWGDKELKAMLISDKNALKLRRYLNDWRPEYHSTSFAPK